MTDDKLRTTVDTVWTQFKERFYRRVGMWCIKQYAGLDETKMVTEHDNNNESLDIPPPRPPVTLLPMGPMPSDRPMVSAVLDGGPLDGSAVQVLEGSARLVIAVVDYEGYHRYMYELEEDGQYRYRDLGSVPPDVAEAG